MFSRFDFFSETLCKVNTFFRHGQILMRFLTNFLFQPRYSHPKTASAGLSSEKRVQSYNLSTKQPNLLCTFLKKYYGKIIQNNANSWQPQSWGKHTNKHFFKATYSYAASTHQQYNQPMKKTHLYITNKKAIWLTKEAVSK